jgi:hypothetical protein
MSIQAAKFVFGPAMVAVVGVLFGTLFARYVYFDLGVLLAVGFPSAAVIFGIAREIRRRRRPDILQIEGRCRRCGYHLQGHAAPGGFPPAKEPGRFSQPRCCPECGFPMD